MDGMNSSPTTGIIDAAVARVQAAMGTIQNNAKAAGRGGSTSSYTTFAALCEAVKPFLDAEEITVYQGGVEGARSERMVTRLSKGGEWIESSFPLKPSSDGGQGFGGAISFAKRWGLCGMLKLVTSDDAEEKRGYQDLRPVKPSSKPRAPAELAGLLAGIRDAQGTEELERRATAARAANPTGEAAAAVEKTITSWYVAAIEGAKNLDALTLIRDSGNRVKVRGSEAREALREAGRRFEGGQS